MKRRTFLAAVGTSAAVALWPRLIRRAFADASFDAPGTRKPASASPSSTPARRIDPSQRPQLVIVVPADDAQKYRRGELWGEYLNHATPGQLAPLAQVDVLCATMADVRAWAPSSAAMATVAGEPLALLFERDGSVHPLDARYPSYASTGRLDPRDENSVVDRRIAAVAAMVARGLPPVAGRDIPAAAARVVRAVRQQPPAGSHWARASGCGPATVENMKDDSNEIVAIGCGMGHVPEKSSRFLYFFAKSPQQMEREWLADERKKQRPTRP
jgi:hypothetical protein